MLGLLNRYDRHSVTLPSFSSHEFAFREEKPLDLDFGALNTAAP